MTLVEALLWALTIGLGVVAVVVVVGAGLASWCGLLVDRGRS